MAEVKFSDNEINTAINAAVLAALGETGRAKIIEEAVAHLTAKDKYRDRSPLMDVIDQTATTIARAVLSKKMEEDEEFQKNIHSLYEDAVKRLFDADSREKIVTKLADAMSTALTKSGY